MVPKAEIEKLISSLSVFSGKCSAGGKSPRRCTVLSRRGLLQGLSQKLLADNSAVGCMGTLLPCRYPGTAAPGQALAVYNFLLAEAANLAAGDYIAYRIRIDILPVYTLDVAIRHRVAIQKHFSRVR